MRAIFHKEWLYVAHVSQLPDIGSFLTFDIGEEPLLIVHGHDNKIRAFYNVCAHRGHLLASGSGKASHFTCPYHAWTYNLEGRLRAAKGIRDPNQLPECHRGLTEIDAAIRHGFVFVRLSRGDASLDDLYGSFFPELIEKIPAFDRLRFVKRIASKVDGNWKIMIENYLECYHCCPTHPALADLICISDYSAVQSEFFLSTRAPAGSANNIAYSYDIQDDTNRDFFGWWLWPNVTFNIFPGQPNLLIFHMLPVNSEVSIGYCDYFFLDGVVNDEAQALMEWEGNILEKEDNDLIVAAHRGMKSRALANGIFVVDSKRHDISEGPLAHFNQLISRALAPATPR